MRGADGASPAPGPLAAAGWAAMAWPVISLATCVLAWLELRAQHAGDPALLLAAAGVTVPLAARSRHRLLPVLAASATAIVLVALTGRTLPGLGDPPTSFALAAAWLVAVYTAGTHPRLGRAVIGLGAGAAGGAVMSATSQDPTPETVLAAMLFSVAVPWLVGLVVRRQTLVQELARRVAAAEAAATGERSRIARDVHDVVAHTVSMMVVQAEAADLFLDDQPQRARQALAAIRGAGRQSLQELRSVLGFLGDADAAAERAPSPGVADISALVARVGEAGLEVDLSVSGDPAGLPLAAGKSAYRVVQECLTNALRYAPDGPASVRISHGVDRTEIVVVTTGSGSREWAGAGAGLAGIRERVHVLGGSLEAGPGEHGFRVHAVLPRAGGPT